MIINNTEQIIEKRINTDKDAENLDLIMDMILELEVVSMEHPDLCPIGLKFEVSQTEYFILYKETDLYTLMFIKLNGVNSNIRHLIKVSFILDSTDSHYVFISGFINSKNTYVILTNKIRVIKDKKGSTTLHKNIEEDLGIKVLFDLIMKYAKAYHIDIENLTLIGDVTLIEDIED